MKWLIDAVKACLPFHTELRKLKCGLLGYEERTLTDDRTIGQGLLQTEWLREHACLQGASVLEIGSGWQPMIPILFSLAGARRVYLTDREELCNLHTFTAAVRSLRRNAGQIARRLGLGESAVAAALDWRPADGLARGFERFRLRYLAPCDCRRLPLAGESVDIVTSRAVLEHIEPRIIREILDEAFRLLRPGGLTCHFVDNSDHWAHQDPSISRVNFLRYPDWVFRWTCVNSLDYQNRLRHSEYRELLVRGGFTVVREEGRVDPDALALLETMSVSGRFRGLAREDLATTATYLLARKPARLETEAWRAPVRTLGKQELPDLVLPGVAVLPQ